MGGWIKFDKDMADDPRLIQAATSLLDTYLIAHRMSGGGADLSIGDASRFVTAALRGALVTLWVYADTHIRDDDSLPINAMSLEALVGIEGFASLLPTDWLSFNEQGLVVLPGYCSKNGLVAKRQRAKAGAERTRQWRERKNAASDASQPRHRDVTVTADQDQDQDHTKTKRESEGSAEGREPSRKRSGQPPPSKAKLATRIPEGWQPSPDLVAYAEKELPNVDTAKLAESFTDYWQAAAGAKARKLDWDATWRTWVRRSCDRYPTKTQSRAMSPQIRIDANGRQISG
jgi:hypothetical protein